MTNLKIYSSAIMPNKHYYLSWEHYTQHISNNLLDLFKNQHFVDLTLSCDGHTIGVHKCVLAAASSYFHDKFLEHPHADLVIVKSININILRGLIHFLYHGGVYVSHCNLIKFLQAANFFKFHGLCGIETQVLASETLENFNDIALEPPDFLTQNKIIEYNEIEEEYPIVNGEYDYSENEIFIPTENEPSIIANQTENHGKDETLDQINKKRNDKVVVEKIQIIENFCKTNLNRSKEDSSQKIDFDDPNKALKILEEAGVPTDVPIYCEGNDGNYIELTNDLLKDIASGGKVVYQIIDEEGKPSELRFGGPINPAKSTETSPKEVPTAQITTPEPIVLKNEIVRKPEVLSEKNIKSTNLNDSIKSEPLIENIANTPSKVFTRVRKPPSSNSDFVKFDIRKRVKKKTEELASKKPVIEKNILSKKNESNISNNSTEIERPVVNYNAFVKLEQTIHPLQNDPNKNLSVKNEEKTDQTNDITLVQLAALKRKKNSESSTRKRTISKSIIDKRKTKKRKVDGVIPTKSKEIPYALGLLPLQKALRKIQDTPDHSPRSTRSNLRYNVQKKS